jgi:hypothetical protein
MAPASQTDDSGTNRGQRFVGSRIAGTGGLPIHWLSRRPFAQGAVSRVPVRDEFKERLELACAENFGDRGVHVTEDDPAAVLANQAVQRHKVTQGSRTRKAHPAQVDDQVGTSGLAQMRIVVIAQFKDRGGVESQAIPEFRNQEPTDIMSLNRGLKH